MLKIKLFKKSSQSLWPLIRPLVKHKLSARCVRCIVSENYQQLNQGVCNDCLEYETKKTPLKEKLNRTSEMEATVQNYVQKGRKGYDALVLFSGGKDSTMLIYKLQTLFPQLRVLAVTIDNGIMSPVALDNIKIIVNKLNINHIMYKPGHHVFERAFKYGLEQVKGRGCSQVVDQLDGDLFHDISFHLAAKMGIPLIISGLSVEQVEDIIKIRDFKLPRSALEQRRKFSGVLELSKFTQQADFDNYWWSPEHYNELPDVIYPNYEWNYNHDLINTILTDKCGLKSARLDPMLTNNLLVPIMGVIDIRQIGYSSFEPEFSKMVRSGIANRRYWINIFQFIEYLAKFSHAFDQDVNRMFLHLGVDEKEVFYIKD